MTSHGAVEAPVNKGSALARHSILPLGVSDAPGVVPVSLSGDAPIARATSLKFVSFERTDLEAQKQFLTDFGLVVIESGSASFHARARGSNSYCVEVRKGKKNRFTGFGLAVDSKEDFDRLTLVPGAKINQHLTSPGGGSSVTLRDPAGFEVSAIFGQQEAAPIPANRPVFAVNTVGKPNRVNAENRSIVQPSHVARLGHLVLQVADFEITAQFYMKHFGFIPTDVQYLDNGEPNLAFMRLDLGDQPADHHTLVVAGGVVNEFEHCAFEVLDLDDVGQGQQYLKSKGWQHAWGIGRHWLGSQIFDYWQDPAGAHFEHYTDGDLYDSSAPTRYSPLSRASLYQWGDDLPQSFAGKPTPAALWALVKGLLSGAIKMERVKMIMGAMKRKPRPWLK